MINKLFNRKPSAKADALQDAIDSIIADMRGFTSDSEEYSNCADQLAKLMKLQKDTTSDWRPSPDAIVSAGASIAGILLILHYEQAAAIGSKALSFIAKAR